MAPTLGEATLARDRPTLTPVTRVVTTTEETDVMATVSILRHTRGYGDDEVINLADHTPFRLVLKDGRELWVEWVLDDLNSDDTLSWGVSENF